MDYLLAIYSDDPQNKGVKQDRPDHVWLTNDIHTLNDELEAWGFVLLTDHEVEAMLNECINGYSWYNEATNMHVNIQRGRFVVGYNAL